MGTDFMGSVDENSLSCVSVRMMFIAWSYPMRVPYVKRIKTSQLVGFKVKCNRMAHNAYSPCADVYKYVSHHKSPSIDEINEHGFYYEFIDKAFGE